MENEIENLGSIWVRNTGEKEFCFVCCWKEDGGKRCSFTSESEQQLRSHLLLKHWEDVCNSGFLSCKVENCCLETEDKEQLRRHFLHHFYHAQLQAKGMAVIFSDEKLRDFQRCNGAGVSGVNPGEVLTCQWEGCLNQFEEIPRLAEHVCFHVRTLAKSNLFSCKWEGCSYENRSRRMVVAHINTHSGAKKSACPFCGAVFCDHKTKLSDHLFRKTGGQQTRLKCFLCQKHFETQRLLREHSRRHVKHYKCPFCDMTVETPSDLKRHVSIRHAAERPYHCFYCLKKFISQHDLDRHSQTHLPPAFSTVHQCEQCGKTFKTKQWLDSHSRRHAEPTPYACHLCSSRFGLGALMGQHLRRVHKLVLPAGHSRFQFKKCADGLNRLLTERYESEQMVEFDRDSAEWTLRSPSTQPNWVEQLAEQAQMLMGQ